MSKQHQFKEPLFVEINGIPYEGYRIVKGTRKLNQTIYFKDLKDLDTQTYEYPKRGCKLFCVNKKALLGSERAKQPSCFVL